MLRRNSACGECGPPLSQRLPQCGDRDSSILVRTCRQIFPSPFHQRESARDVAGRMMVKRDRGLDEALQKSLFQALGFAPYVFPNFMGVIEFARIEEVNSAV